MDRVIVGALMKLIKCAVDDDFVSSSFSCCNEETIDGIYRISENHDIGAMVGYALEKGNCLLSENQKEKFRKQINTAIYRYSLSENDLYETINAFEKAGIDFIPLKGSVIRNYYAEPFLRTSCDIDILVRREDIKKAASVLINGNKCSQEGKINSHDIPLCTQSGVNIELHYDLIEDSVSDSSQFILEKVWESAKRKKDYSHFFVMSNEMMYFYHLAHMAKHLMHGGCGIRPFIDLYLLDKKLQTDKDELTALIKKGGLETFNESVHGLMEVWFGNGTESRETALFEDYILSGGVYGTVQNSVAVNQAYKGGKLRYAISRIFLPYKEIKYHYPILQKHKWLLPLCWVRRWLKLIFGGGLKRSVNELKINRTISGKEANEKKELLKNLNLNNR